MTPRKNQSLTLEITGMSAEGLGVGRAEGLVVFVPLTAPGDLVQVKLVKVAKTHAYGRLEGLARPSPHRIEPDCPVFAQCGGCCYRHLRYEEELRIKEERVRDALARIGGFADPPVRPILGADSRDGYRNKALLPLAQRRDGGLAMGFYARNSHRVVDCRRCALQPEPFHRAMAAFRQWAQAFGDPIYDEATHTGRMRRLYLRMGQRTGEVMACVVVNGGGLRHEKELALALRETVPGLASVVISPHRERTNVALGKTFRTIWGRDWIEDELSGLRVRLSPQSFYQVNHAQTQRIYEKAAEYAALSGKETVLDLYCGAGAIGLSMAGWAKRVLGVEIVPEAVENARENAAINGVGNAEFFHGDAAQAAEELARRGQRPDVVVLDPPRKGCAPELVETVAAMAPGRVVYVSCDPATLARDLRRFAGLGYPLIEATPVDMFPATAHVETVALLRRQPGDQEEP